jgi:hypothetical protein
MNPQSISQSMKKRARLQRRKMLRYYKQVIDKVSFSAFLFEKELRKAIRSILPDDLPELAQWAYAKFGHIYGQILDSLLGRQESLAQLEKS